MWLHGALSCMRHDYFQKKYFDLLTEPQGQRVLVGTEYYVLAWCSIPFNLIRNMTNFNKNNV